MVWSPEDDYKKPYMICADVHIVSEVLASTFLIAIDQVTLRKFACRRFE